jgi:hypothetical protein
MSRFGSLLLNGNQLGGHIPNMTNFYSDTGSGSILYLQSNLFTGDFNKTDLLGLVTSYPGMWCSSDHFNVGNNCLIISEADLSTLTAACAWNPSFAPTLQQYPNENDCIEQPPSTPSSIIAVADVLSVNLTWAASTAWRSMPITSYTILVINGSYARNLTVGASPSLRLSTDVAPLLSNVSYSFLVMARSASGTFSGISAPSNTVRPCASTGEFAPDAPSDIWVNSSVENVLTVGWSAAPFSRCWASQVLKWNVSVLSKTCSGEITTSSHPGVSASSRMFTLANLSLADGTAFSFQESFKTLS